MKRFNVKADIAFRTNQEDATEAKKRFLEVLIAINKLLPPTEALTLVDITTKDVKVEQLIF